MPKRVLTNGRPKIMQIGVIILNVHCCWYQIKFGNSCLFTIFLNAIYVFKNVINTLSNFSVFYNLV